MSSEPLEHGDGRNTEPVKRDYKKPPKQLDDQDSNSNQPSTSNRSGFDWISFGFIGFYGSVMMAAVCGIGTCGRYASEIWLGIGLICITIAGVGLKYA